MSRLSHTVKPEDRAAFSDRPEEVTLARNLWILYAAVGGSDFIFGATYVRHMVEVGLSSTEIGALLGGSFVIALIIQVPTGVLGDRFGYRRIAYTGLIVWGFGFICFAISGTIWTTAVALIFWSLGLSAYSGAPTSLVVNILQQHDHDDAVVARAIRGAQVSRWLAAATGAGIVAVFERMVSVSFLVFLAGCSLALTGLWMRITWPEAIGQQGGKNFITFSRTFSRDIWSFSLFRVGLLNIAAMSLFALMLTSWQLMFHTFLRLPDSNLGVALFFLTIASALGAWATRYMRKRHTETLIWIILVTMSLSLLITGTNTTLTFAGYIIAEVASGALGVLIIIQAQSSFEGAIRNTLTGIFAAMSSASMALTNVVFGVVWRNDGLVGAVRNVSAAIPILLLALMACAVFGRLTLRRTTEP